MSREIMMASYTDQTEQNTLRAGAAFVRNVLASSVLGLGLIIVPGMAAEGLVAKHRTLTTSVDRAIGTDGVHLYGEVSKPNQPGKGYVIFSKAGSQVIGAIYYPQSEFSCFVGKQADTRLNVNLVESGRASEGVEVRLKPMYAIHTIGSAEASALAVCRQEAAPVRQRAEQTARTPAFSLPRT
jgi:hypothetical protein